MHTGFRSLALVLPISSLSACTVMRLGAEEGPARVESNGLIDGHVALGMRADDDLLRVRLFEGGSEGSVAELSVWKLFRIEVGLLGLGVGVGPVDAALGIGFYDPDVPEMEGQEPEPPTDDGADGAHPDCPACARGI